MANARQPDNLHLLKGTYRKDRHGDPKKKLKVNTEFPECPAWMPSNAKREWARIKKVMNASGVITLGDATILSQYCILVAELEIEQTEFSGAKHTQLRMCAIELGLTPVARSKITVPQEEDNEF